MHVRAALHNTEPHTQGSQQAACPAVVQLWSLALCCWTDLSTIHSFAHLVVAVRRAHCHMQLAHGLHLTLQCPLPRCRCHSCQLLRANCRLSAAEQLDVVTHNLANIPDRCAQDRREHPVSFTGTHCMTGSHGCALDLPNHTRFAGAPPHLIKRPLTSTRAALPHTSPKAVFSMWRISAGNCLSGDSAAYHVLYTHCTQHGPSSHQSAGRTCCNRNAWF